MLEFHSGLVRTVAISTRMKFEMSKMVVLSAHSHAQPRIQSYSVHCCSFGWAHYVCVYRLIVSLEIFEFPKNAFKTRFRTWNTRKMRFWRVLLFGPKMYLVVFCEHATGHNSNRICQILWESVYGYNVMIPTLTNIHENHFKNSALTQSSIRTPYY